MDITQQAFSPVPRFEARSPDFELVGALESGRLLLYLDRADDNAPVAGARLEVEGAGIQGVAAPIEDGTYALAFAPPPGRHAIVVTVQAGNDSDLLNGVIDVSGIAPAQGSTAPPWAAGAGLLIAIAAAWAWLQRRRGRP